MPFLKAFQCATGTFFHCFQKSMNFAIKKDVKFDFEIYCSVYAELGM
jgi:hypothetical protein